MDAVTSSRIHPALVLLVDLVFVVVFAAIGRATHDGDVLGPAGSGLATTAWPFVVALGLGWLISRGWRAPLAPVRTGLIVWVVTVAVGMVLRAVSGQGVAVAFVIVAAITLALFLVGWRAIARLASRRRRAA
ncbi:membrane protein [Microbacterium testaceum]|jgi:hypothetical protein|uniref:DUF3054 domain-containing protein n=1 Tax=Microbacterium TaxID=33882 RepID=UPI0007341ACD|nr:DUF3054 domain-containing protein [Microbacterium testaceum]KTS64835.1 membrane protein [Microbacterium testaceum]